MKGHPIALEAARLLEAELYGHRDGLAACDWNGGADGGAGEHGPEEIYAGRGNVSGRAVRGRSRAQASRR